MSQLNPADAEKLPPGQATALVQVLDLQARWDVLLTDKAQKNSLAGLQARQKTSDAYQAALRGYGSKYRNAHIPEPTQAMPDRLALWCRVLRVVFRKAEGGSPAQVLARVYRLADRVAARMGREPVGRGSAGDLQAAVLELDAVIAWCDDLAPPAPPLKPRDQQA